MYLPRNDKKNYKTAAVEERPNGLHNVSDNFFPIIYFERNEQPLDDGICLSCALSYYVINRLLSLLFTNITFIAPFIINISNARKAN